MRLRLSRLKISEACEIGQSGQPGHQVLGSATLSRHWSARQTFWSTLRPAGSGTEIKASSCFELYLKEPALARLTG